MIRKSRLEKYLGLLPGPRDRRNLSNFMAREKVVKNNSGASSPDPDIPSLPENVSDDIDESSVNALRPRSFEEYVGQQDVITSLQVAVKAAQQRGESVDHVLFHGPPGLGKTTLAHIMARELDTRLTRTSGPTLERPLDMLGLLSNIEQGEVLFIDERHRIPHAVEEYLYSAMEDFKVDFVTGKGAYSRTLTFSLKPFTLVGATTRAGMLSSPLRDRFGMTYSLYFYTIEELTQVVNRSSSILGVDVDPDGAIEIAQRSRGTPRIANRLLRRVRDYAQVGGQGRITKDGASVALGLEGVDALGLDRLDRLYLYTLAHQYNGGPAGIEAIAATVNEDTHTLVDVVEPFLLKIGFVIRTPSGRRTTVEGMRHIGAPVNDTTDHRRQASFEI